MSSKLELLREKAGKSRLQVARETGIPYTTLERLEKGEISSVVLQHLHTLSGYYHVEPNLNTLLDWSGGRRPR